MNNLTPESTEITIYSATWCGPCKMAKKFLTENGFSFNDIDIEENNITREEMAAMTKGTTVPQIIINDIPIGGFEDLLQYFQKHS
ncbi:MAG: glutaredoxin domain-containing protein [Candidatus Marinimicrobia bacterium]|nr:glutaredoxin domain-containing protein [Candidatus Neomarinimicrobiota bacterium]